MHFVNYSFGVEGSASSARNARLNGAPPELREVIDASLESYVKEESHRAKLDEQDKSDLVSAKCASHYEGKKEKLENAVASAHDAAQLAVTLERRDRVLETDLEDQRETARREISRNEALNEMVDGHRKGVNRIHQAIVPLIEARRAQVAVDGKGKGRDIPWEKMLSPKVLEEVRPDELIRRARQAGVKDLDLQQAPQSVEPWVPPGMLKADDFVVGKDCSVCHMYGTTAPWVWQDSRALLQQTIICKKCYACVKRDGGMYVNGGWWRFVSADC